MHHRADIDKLILQEQDTLTSAEHLSSLVNNAVILPWIKYIWLEEAFWISTQPLSKCRRILHQFEPTCVRARSVISAKCKTSLTGSSTDMHPCQGALPSSHTIFHLENSQAYDFSANLLPGLLLLQCIVFRSSIWFYISSIGKSEINGVKAGLVQTLILKLREKAKSLVTLCKLFAEDHPGNLWLPRKGSITTNKLNKQISKKLVIICRNDSENL